ncbi:hypothetical protein MPER_05126 [Moniliophthora perniciosa FA553]|nr:hypothetical protein MPER_05126 [Moniliophthora perniciosa FA553]
MSSDSATEASDDTTENDNALPSDVESDSPLEDMSRMEASVRAVFHAQKHPVDHFLEKMLDHMCTVKGEERSKIPRSPDGYLTSTKTIPRRRIFRLWPRDPEGTIYHSAPETKCKPAPNATQL